MLSEQNDADESFTQDEAPRRLRIFHDITQRNAGKSNETQKVISQAQGLLDWTSPRWPLQLYIWSKNVI